MHNGVGHLKVSRRGADESGVHPPAGGSPSPSPRVNCAEEAGAGLVDAGLFGAVLAGGDEAFAELFTRYAPMVFSFSGRRSGDWSAAEDLTSVVFLEAWRTRERAFLVEDSLRPWLLGIAANVVSTSRRGLRRYRAALLRFAAAGEADYGGPDVAADAVRLADLDRTSRLVRAAIDRLPRGQREVVELCLLGELSAVQAAAALSLPISTVRSRLEDGRATLRRLLQSRDVDRPSWLIGHQ